MNLNREQWAHFIKGEKLAAFYKTVVTWSRIPHDEHVAVTSLWELWFPFVPTLKSTMMSHANKWCSVLKGEWTFYQSIYMFNSVLTNVISCHRHKIFTFYILCSVCMYWKIGKRIQSPRWFLPHNISLNFYSDRGSTDPSFCVWYQKVKIILQTIYVSLPWWFHIISAIHLFKSWIQLWSLIFSISSLTDFQFSNVWI